MLQLVLPIAACHLCGSEGRVFGTNAPVCPGCILSALERAKEDAMAIARRLALYTHDCPAEGCLVCMVAS